MKCAEGPEESVLVAELEARMGVQGIRLMRIQPNCVSKAYRAMRSDGTAFFTKWSRVDSAKALGFLSAVLPDPILPQPIKSGTFTFCDGWVTSYVWRESTSVSLERMTDAQFSSFCTAYCRLTRALQAAPEVGAQVDGDALMARIRAYARQFPLLKGLLANLLSLEREDYAYSADTPQVVIHGDLHAGNFGFADDGSLFFCDFDLLARGSEVDDLAFLLGEHVRRSGMSRSGISRLLHRRDQLIRLVGRPLSDWRVALNLLRLRMADKLIARHPHDVRTMWNVLIRDRRLRVLLKGLRPTAPTAPLAQRGRRGFELMRIVYSG